MAITYKVLGQSAPAAATPDDLYTVPALTQAVASSIIVCNRSASADAFRVSIAVGGGVTANADYLYYDVAIGGNDTFIATIGITLATTDVVRVYSTNGTLSFNLSGSEIT